jgi:hypothetical protein
MNLLGLSQFSKSAYGTILFGALSGGVGAELSGGNFWQGAIVGGVVAGLNHTMHRMGTSANQTSRQQGSNDTEIINPNASQKKGAKSLRMLGSFVAYDRDKTFAGKALQILSHFTWELPQQIIGLFTGQFVNLIGGIESVDRYTNGSIVLKSGLLMPGAGYTMGNIITVSSASSIDLISHEFGHYIQSRRFGPLWIPTYGIPSIVRAGLWSWGIIGGNYDSFYTESNATNLGLKYW